MKHINTMKLFALSVISILFGLIFYSLFIYSQYFPNCYSSDINDWGQTGSYFGGIIGSLLSFITAILLIYSIAKQHNETLFDRKTQTTNSIYDIIFRLLTKKASIDESGIETHVTKLKNILNAKPSSNNMKAQYIDEFHKNLGLIQDDKDVRLVSSIIIHAFQLIGSHDIERSIKSFLNRFLYDSLNNNEKELITVMFLSQRIDENQKIVIMNNFEIEKYDYGLMNDLAQEQRIKLTK